MQRTASQYLAALIVIIAVYGCKSRNPEANDSDIKWGHLNGEALKPTSPQFLINKKRRDSIRVCLAKYMMDTHPGIDQEVDAAINIWSTYLGRKIPVKIDFKDLPRAKASDTEDTLAKVYFEKCGKDYDVVIGYGPLNGNTIGLTGVYSMVVKENDGSDKVVSFNRFLFLRDLSVSPFAINGSNVGWQSFAQRSGGPITSDKLLAAMASRKVRFYNTDNNLLTLSTLTHEFGHVWGLCDQYESSDNCDPAHSTSHPVLDSVMGSPQFREITYLTDDDIVGIRALAARPGFKQDWADTKALTDVPAPIEIPALEFVRINKLDRGENKLTISYSVLTHVPTKLKFSLVPSDGSAELSLQGDFVSPDSGFEKPAINLNIGMPKSDKKTYNVRAVLSFKNAGGEWVTHKELLTSDPK